MAHVIVAEVRPRLQACSVFIITEDGVFSRKMLKISLKPSSIDITWSSNGNSTVQRISLPGCKLVPNTLSCLRAEDGYVSFRVQTEPFSGLRGSFSTEIVPLSCGNNVMDGGTNVEVTVKVRSDEKSQVSCRCCGNSLACHSFQRVLPLPSSGFDSSEWFCHNHGNVSFSATPQAGDLLYGTCYYLMSREVLLPSALSPCSKRVIRCRRCLGWLGTSASSCITLWNCTASFGGSCAADPLKDFIRVVATAVAACVGLMCRVLVETQLTDCETHYLLIWAIDKNLQILTNSKSGEAASMLEGEEIIETVLQSHNTVKLLYLHQSSRSSVVKAWQDDVNVQCVEVAKSMFTKGLEHLGRMTKCIPLPYRITNDYFTAYLEM